LGVEATLAQSGDGAATTGVVLNHVGLSVPSVPEAAAFYKEKLGLKEAFRNSDAQGNPTAIYLQISKGTFLELQQANAQRPAGVNHFGLESPDIKATVAAFARARDGTEPGGPAAPCDSGK
jgi:catechol 2,3-dioxygenase-like lactoylglutathione lyase family enzyme